MPPRSLTLAGLLLVGVASAQSPQQPTATPALDPARDRLDALLLRWEQEMRNVQSLEADCIRTTDDKTWGHKDVRVGKAKFLRPGLALLEMRDRENPQEFEKYVCTGTYVYEYRTQAKQIVVHEMPPPKPGQVADDSFLSFLFGMKAEEAKRRYQMQLANPNDPHYVYIDIFPRLPSDKADFQWARMVLNNKTFLPRQLYFVQPNQNSILWDIPRIMNGARLSRTEFTSPAVPAGWSMVKAPRQNDLPPRVVRPTKP